MVFLVSTVYCAWDYCSCLTSPWINIFLGCVGDLECYRSHYITRLLGDKEESEEPKKEEKSVRSPRLVRGVLIDTEEYMSTPNLKKCTPVVMIRKDKLDKYTIPGDIEIVTKKSISGSRLITFLECQDELYSILKVPGKFWYSKRLGVILGLGNKEIDQFIEKIKTK